IVDSHKFSAVITSSSQLDSPPIINVPRSRFDEVLGGERSAILFNDFEQAELHQEVSRKLASFPQLMYRVVAEFHASSDKPILNTRKESEDDFGLLKNGSFHHYYPTFGPVEKWVNRTEVIAKIEKKGLDPE